VGGLHTAPGGAVVLLGLGQRVAGGVTTAEHHGDLAVGIVVHGHALAGNV
jgi:hypothetical protein